MKTREEWLVEVAVTQTGRALEYVPKELMTLEMCKLALANDSGAYLFVPNRVRHLMDAHE